MLALATWTWHFQVIGRHYHNSFKNTNESVFLKNCIANRIKVYSWPGKLQSKKQFHHRVDLVAVVVLSVVSQDIHQLMEFAHLWRKWLFLKLLFPRSKIYLEPQLWSQRWQEALKVLRKTGNLNIYNSMTAVCWWGSCEQLLNGLFGEIVQSMDWFIMYWWTNVSICKVFY